MIFIKLAEIGEGTLDTRRRAAFSELITRATDPVIIDAVLGILTDARLITTDTLEPGDTRVVEVAHEALIREWPTLRDWLNQNRAGLLLHRQLTEDTNDWIKLDRDAGALYRGMRLQQNGRMVESQHRPCQPDRAGIPGMPVRKFALEETLQRQGLERRPAGGRLRWEAPKGTGPGRRLCDPGGDRAFRPGEWPDFHGRLVGWGHGSDDESVLGSGDI